MACAGIAVVHGFRRHWGSWNASLTDMGRGDCLCFWDSLLLSHLHGGNAIYAVHPYVSYPPSGQELQVGGIYTVEIGRCYRLEPLCLLFEAVVKHL